MIIDVDESVGCQRPQAASAAAKDVLKIDGIAPLDGRDVDAPWAHQLLDDVGAQHIVEIQMHRYWYALAALLGADLAQASVTGYCPLAALLRSIGIRFGAAFQA